MKAKKIYKGLAGILLSLLLLVGCSSQPQEYPVMESIDPDSIELSYAANSLLSVKYPAGSWISQPNSDPLMLMYAETYSQDMQVNINVQLSSECDGDLDETLMEQIMTALREEYGDSGAIQVTLSEMRLLNDKPVIYTETVYTINDQLIDFMLEEGSWSEEWIASIGGRETLLSIPATDEVTIYAVIDGHIIIYTGTYGRDDQKQAVIDAITVLVQTTALS